MSDERETFLNGMEEIRHPSYRMKLMKFQMYPPGMETLAAMRNKLKFSLNYYKKSIKFMKLLVQGNLQSSVGNLHP
jgi:hypothetical protein